MTGIAQRLQAIEGQIGEIKSMLSQMSAASGGSLSDAVPRPPRTKRPPSEGGGLK
jgi:hypothetical protein